MTLREARDTLKVHRSEDEISPTPEGVRELDVTDAEAEKFGGRKPRSES